MVNGLKRNIRDILTIRLIGIPTRLVMANAEPGGQAEMTAFRESRALLNHRAGHLPISLLLVSVGRSGEEQEHHGGGGVSTHKQTYRASEPDVRSTDSQGGVCDEPLVCLG